MYRNFFKIAFRSLLKNKVSAFINIAGLAVGMAVAMLIALWMNNELSANQHHQNYQTLYQVMMHQTFDGERSSQVAMPYPLGAELKTKYPDFKAVAMCDWGEKRALVAGNRKFLKKGHYIGAEAIDMFSLPILSGDKNPLKDPYSIVLTEKTAQAIFGKQNPLDQIIRVDNVVDVKVTAVVAEQPQNASLQFDYLLPWDLQIKLYDWVKTSATDWKDNSYQVYVQLKEGLKPEKTEAKIKDVVLNHVSEDKLMQKAIKPAVFLHPMSKWRLYGEFENGKNTGGFIKYVRLFGIFGLFILVIACINFMNLSTARSEKRAKEVGVRKAIGSRRNQLIGQFLSESLLIAFLALVLALILVAVFLPSFNALTEKELSIQFGDPAFWGLMFVFTLFTGLLAGSYPALYLSSFSPLKILKGGFRVGKNAALPRKVLIVVQFSFSIVLMIGTMIIYQQIQFVKNRPIGFNNQGLISITISNDLTQNFDPLRNELLASGMVSSICKASSPASEIWSNGNGWEWRGSSPADKGTLFNVVATTYDYTQTMGIEVKAGRDFSREFSTDAAGVLLNEAAVKRMGLENPVGETIKWNGKTLSVVGVIPNINMESPFQSISPLTIVFDKDWVECLCVRINPHVSSSEAIAKIGPIFDKYNPGFPFDYAFADAEYAKKFKYTAFIGKLSLIVSILAIFISCLGLFGLASFTAEQRTKEIGIRKVLGASVAKLWQSLSKDFVVLVLISCLIATPIAYYFMNEWLQKYTYRIEISWWVFAVAVIGALVITLLTVSYQAIKAALVNPVKSLKSE